MYLESFELPSPAWEEQFLDGDMRLKRTCYTSVYPFQIFPAKGFEEITFSPVTVFYGGNGSGKTTLLNVIANKLEAERGTYFNRSAFFDDYVNRCEYWMPRYARSHPQEIRIITSDDVFDYLLDIRRINEGIDHKKEDLLEEYADIKYSSFQMKSIKDFERLRQSNDAKRLSGSKYVKGRLMGNLPERSNGESAFAYFLEHIGEGGLYLLDEPENSLAVKLQTELAEFLEHSVRFFHCQFIIATHSPLLLAAKEARIYDLDSRPVMVKKWTELSNVRYYFDFFERHREEF